MANRRRGSRKSNRSPQRWLYMSLYPIILVILLLGVTLGGWAAEAVKSDPSITEEYSDRDADEWLKKLGISEMPVFDEIQEAGLEDFIKILGLESTIKDLEKGKISDEDLQKLGLDGVAPEDITLETIINRINEMIEEEIARNDAAVEEEKSEEVIEDDSSDYDEDIDSDEDDYSDDEELDEDDDSEDDSDDIDDEDDDESEEESEEPEEDLTFYYYYNICSAEEQTIYREMLDIFRNFRSLTTISAKDEDTIEKIYFYVMADHPEIFFVHGYHWTSYGNGSSFTFTGDYTYTQPEMLTNKALNEAAARQIADSVPSGYSEYETVKFFCDYLVENTTYLLDCQWNQEISSVFINHQTVCAGYARAMQYLLQLKGIQTLYVMGDTPPGYHAWDVVLVDGKYYHVDVCWCDPNKNTVPNPRYAYLCVPTSRIQIDHTVDEEINPIPECNSMDANYYVQEGLYLESFDPDTIAEIFERSKLINRGVVFLMASDTTTYAAAKNYIESNVWDLYYPNGNYGELRNRYDDDMLVIEIYEKMD